MVGQAAPTRPAMINAGSMDPPWHCWQDEQPAQETDILPLPWLRVNSDGSDARRRRCLTAILHRATAVVATGCAVTRAYSILTSPSDWSRSFIP